MDNNINTHYHRPNTRSKSTVQNPFNTELSNIIRPPDDVHSARNPTTNKKVPSILRRSSSDPDFESTIKKENSFTPKSKMERGTSGSSIKTSGNRKKKIKRAFSRKQYDVDDFVIINKKERKRKQSIDKRLDYDLSSSNILPLASFKEKNEKSQNNLDTLYELNHVNSRLSINLAAPAASIYGRLSKRPLYETLRKSKIIQDPIPIPPYEPPTWTSKVIIEDNWSTYADIGLGDDVLISRDCLQDGYNIEIPRKNLETDLSIIHDDSDVEFFKELCKTSKDIIHFAGKGLENKPVIISVENDKNKKFIRVIMRNPNSDQRFLITVANSSKILKALYDQCPSLSATKLLKVKKDDVSWWTEELQKIETRMLKKTFKFGVLYACDNQNTESEFFNNVKLSENMFEFLECIAGKIELKDWPHFRGGLDVSCSTTGKYSYYSLHRGFEIMFHVSTLIPYYPKDTQQVERKRHLGNDIVLIIFKETSIPFDPRCIYSQFNHVFVVVEPIKLFNKTHYRVEWCAKKGVPPFTPYEMADGIHERNSDFQQWFLTKLINAEKAALKSEEFNKKNARTREMLFNEIFKCKPPSGKK